MPITTFVFDAYGTLLDVNAAARAAASEPAFARLGPIWQDVATTWRNKQLEYSWLRAITQAHTDFWTVTQDALDWALEANDLDGDEALRQRLLDLYRELDAYPEAPDVLSKLKSAGKSTAILSNGSPDMLDAAVSAAGLGSLLDDVLSVETVGVYKPDARVYGMVEARFGANPSQVLFVSSNGWDVAGAAAFGFQTIWINRAGLPVDRMPGRPAHIAADLTAVLETAGV
ncbi:haloacid dehalogenase type II [Celeribacter arenosi]|uniref:(S)-2-haloacid dehalogenase n=1 Tax=Celeribacter arenosi TaxID=792649 RepID=A0ABP7K9F6_9RHOB